jgi:ribose transport system ATP-binding protein
MMEQQNLLDMKDIVKVFNGSKVLDHVDFSVRHGEVHALMGENGAGKSTLIKILTGVYPKDGGEIRLGGQKVEINSRSDAARLGINVIYQELSLIPTLTVAQNIVLGREKTHGGILDTKHIKKEVDGLIEKYGFNLSADAVVESLTIAQRQMVEILKALGAKSRIIIMDEPTASLSTSESETLFKIIRMLRNQGESVIYISHRLEEVYQLADRLTILRDGKCVAVLDHEQIIPSEVVRLMIGKELENSTISHLRVSSNPVILSVKNLTRKGVFKDVSFDLRKGEILGFSGLVGSGRTEVMRAIYGADGYDSGSVLLDGEPVSRSIRENIGKGFGLVPEDRRLQGFVAQLSGERNIALANYDCLTRRMGIVDKDKEQKLGVRMTRDMNIKPSNPKIAVGSLSGGNQQKAVLAKWLSRDLRILIIDEPTAGIDVGAKEEIYNFMRKLADKGTAIIMVSSDLKEILQVSTRIIVMKRGRVFTQFESGNVTQEDLLLAESGIEKGEDAR